MQLNQMFLFFIIIYLGIIRLNHTTSTPLCCLVHSPPLSRMRSMPRALSRRENWRREPRNILAHIISPWACTDTKRKRGGGGMGGGQKRIAGASRTIFLSCCPPPLSWCWEDSSFVKIGIFANKNICCFLVHFTKSDLVCVCEKSRSNPSCPLAAPPPSEPTKKQKLIFVCWHAQSSPQKVWVHGGPQKVWVHGGPQKGKLAMRIEVFMVQFIYRSMFLYCTVHLRSVI